MLQKIFIISLITAQTFELSSMHFRRERTVASITLAEQLRFLYQLRRVELQARWQTNMLTVRREMGRIFPFPFTRR